MSRDSPQSSPEQPFFFQLGPDQLFAMLHVPGSGRPRRGVVFCHALAEEKLWSHRVFVTLAREWAQQGMAVLRFDCRGEGDSDLEFEQAGIGSRVDDAVRAAEVLLEHLPELGGLTFLGHRLGAAVAAAAAARLQERARGLIVWDPVQNGREYLMQLLRSNLANQMTVQGSVTRTREALVKALDAGELVHVDGYGIGTALYRDLTALDWGRLLGALACPALVIQVEKSSGGGAHAAPETPLTRNHKLQYASAREPAFWRESRELHRRAPNMAALSLQWLVESAS
ncbi:MAG: hypothetical protein A3I01_10810 [Betaproteobacteria bacterium RIFCSPLOWO2_02_FULL_65_24]|nr:MAG: hypothetical protein A3I01_10810 [Betaproteobacteria bacterium RIFCSPLOWO2_02_FULL_65_24]